MSEPEGFDLAEAARQAMLAEGFAPDPTPAVLEEVRLAAAQRPVAGDGLRDLRELPWSSIDNHDSRDLDQLEVLVERGGATRVLVAVADVDWLVPRGSATDAQARRNTTSVYAGVRVFPMLPEALSTDLTSLNPDADRAAMVAEFEVAADGELGAFEVYRALVRSRARLSYDDVAAWLEGGPEPEGGAGRPEILEQVRRQDEIASRLRAQRHRRGALELETVEAKAVAPGGQVEDVTVWPKNRARDLIEDFMVATNRVIARFLEESGCAHLERVVKAPVRWPRLVELARGLGAELPAEPDPVALAAFLRRRRGEDPGGFRELSLTVVKLLGPGEYVVERPGQDSGGHFGLAAPDYTHSTAPNRRYADLVTQRVVKAALAGRTCAYGAEELEEIARDCTERENAARKVERTARKQAAAVLLLGREGESFEAVVTGVSRHGTFVRLLQPAAEGRIVRGEQGLDVGDAVRVRLLAVEPVRAFLDFESQGALASGPADPPSLRPR